jgi:GH25 family lysozyme M1 (1,4-beta-N-acetylmuramidase)
MKELVIDVSKHNGTVDYSKVKAEGVYGVIIRAGYGKLASQKDPKFEENYKNAKAAGLHVGAYWYSYAKSANEVKTEMEVFLSIVKDKTWDMFLAFDLEDASQTSLGKTTLTSMASTALEKINKAGYTAVLYSNPNWLSSYLNVSSLPSYTKYWVACYTTSSKYSQWYDQSFASMWQYSEKGTISGISGNVDMNYCYVDFPSLSGGASSTTTSSNVKTETRTATTNVNYRCGASTASAVAGVITKNGKVDVVVGFSTECNGYTWVKIIKNNKEYYVVEKYLSASTSSTTKNSTTSKSSTAHTLTIKDGKWNIRSVPSTSGDVVTTVSDNATLEFTSDDEWCYLPEYNGWISASAVEKLS